MRSRPAATDRRRAERRRVVADGTLAQAGADAGLFARHRQQASLAALSLSVIRAQNLSALFDEAAAVTAATLGTEYSVVGEMLQGDMCLVHAGVGWKEGVVGRRASAVGTPAAYLLRSGEPMVIADVRTESRFAIPLPMLAHGVASAIYVIIQGRDRMWGVLSAYTTHPRDFDADDVGFIQSVANLLALAVERNDLLVAQRREQEVLQAVFDNIPVMISFYESSGRLLRANREWERTLGWTVAEAQQVDFMAEAYPDPETHQKALEFICQAARRWTDFRTRTRDGQMLDTSWARFELSDGSRIGFGLDLTERKRADATLAESEARFAKLFEGSPVALAMTTTANDSVIAVNGSWLELFGYRLEEVIGRSTLELGIAVDPPSRAIAVERLRRDGSVRNFEMGVRQKSGGVRAVLISAVLVHLGAHRDYIITALTDVTEQKRAQADREQLVEETRAAHERLEALSRRLLTAQEEERRRLAVELHDELGQVLTAVKINLESVARSFPAAGARDQLAGAIGSVDQAMARVRDIALDLRPSVLDDLGLPPALRWYVDRFARNTGAEAHVAVDAVAGLAPEVETACFRIAQEALTNVARHARARRIWLDLHLLASGLELRVRDDGIGFDIAAARQRATEGASMGLLGMQERVSLAGGDFVIRAVPEGGTEVRALFPVSSRPA